MILNRLFVGFIVVVVICCRTESSKLYKNYIGSWSHDGNRILFYSDRNGKWDIYSIRPDGSELTLLTASTANETEPNCHPHENIFAFSSDSTGLRKIYIKDLDSQRTSATDISGRSPAWSPDGKRMAFLHEQDSLWNLRVYSFDDKKTVTLYQGATYPGRPTWSTSGESVLYSISLDGKETLHYVSLSGTVEDQVVTGFNSIGNATMSPDGSTILFDAHVEDMLDSGDGKWEIYSMKIADGSITRLTRNDKDDWGARWSPDGKKICFMGGGLNNTGYDLFVMNADGTNVIQLTRRE